MLQPMNPQDALALLLPVLDVLEQMGVVYRIGGSVASSYYGVARGTRDVDIVADLRMGQANAFVAAFDPARYFLQMSAVTDAIQHHTSFNIIDLTSMNKVDVFIQPATSQAQQEQQRALQITILPGVLNEICKVKCH